MPREHPQEFDKDLAFSFCAPSHANLDYTLDPQPGSSVMIWLTPSWRSTLVGFAMQVEVAFSKEYYPATGFGIKCICRWKNKEGRSHRIEKNLHCWAPGKAVLKDHMLVFCDVKMRPRTDEGNDPYILADLVVFEFYPVDKQSIRLDDSFTVKRCGVYVITAGTGNTSLESISPVLSVDPVELSDDETEEALAASYDPTGNASLENISSALAASYDPTGNASLENISSALTFDSMDISCNPNEQLIRASYDDLQEIDRALFLYIAYLFNDEDIHLVEVKPLVACIDLNVSSRLKVLAKRHLLSVSSNGAILMLQRGKEILHRLTIGCSEEDFEKIFVASSRCWKYDVFLSFSSQDVRKSFLSHLLKAFISEGITMFIDNEIFSRQAISPQILQAIRESKILIVVFSRDYASSSWLLSELAEIAKSREELSQIVIPIFYYVDPWHVKTLTGDFGRQFRQTCKTQTEDEKKRWCQALINIANIPGISSKNRANEADMTETIANDVLCKLNTTKSEGFGEFVKIENHVSKMNILLSLESEEVRMVGICGPSGIGKTDIARALYSRLAHKFQRTIFVDMSFVYRRLDGYCTYYPDYFGVKVDLQTQFLSEVLGRKYFKVGLGHLCMVREILKDERVLIILDDAEDQVRLLDALVGQTEWFGSGSRIIVIAQDIGILKSYGIDDIYNVDLPSPKEALQMFCQSAFGINYPPDSLMEIAVKVAETVGNLPWALIVLGSYLRGRGKTEWVGILTQIRDSLDGKMEMILRVAYDSLSDHDDKTIYLHIACLFNHDTVEYVTWLLSDSHLGVVCRLKSLAEKSFIHITENGNITMHHLQQNLGREIVRNESIYTPGRRQFLVDAEDILDVFQDNTGTESVLGISLDISKLDRELSISERGFSGMTNLRFLKFYTNLGNKEAKMEVNVHLPHDLDYLCPKLRLLHWEAFPMRCMPTNFSPENLVQLVMQASKLEKLWSETQPLRSLKCMSLRSSLNLREIPDLSYATSLEKLDLRGCSSLTELPSSIWNLHKLKDLDMGYCTHLMTLPTDINLESLHYLNLSGCSRLRSFPEISRSISDLYLDGTAIEEVPCWIENISRLSHLSMNGCNKLKKISSNISKLKCLVEVDFSDCESLTEESWQNHPKEISTSLTSVNMSGNSFQRLPDTWTSIQPKDLIFHSCRNLVSLPKLPTSLFRLTANNCESLESLDGSHSFRYPQATFQFINCFKLNQHARELILQSECAYAILPGEEVPAHFTHRAAGSVLTISLPRSSLSKRFPSFKACIMIESGSGSFHFGVVWPFKGGRDKIYYSCLTNTPSTRNHLIVFHCEFSPDKVSNSPAELNYNDVQFVFDCLDHKKEMIKIKECGIQLLEVSPSDGSRKGFETKHCYDYVSNNNQVGFRFCPTDEELINFYLKNKILGNNLLVDNWIGEINIHSYEPESLPALSKIKSNDLVWYFFSPYESTKRKRTTPSGFWKSTGVDRKIKDKGGDGCQIGIIKTLVYHKGKGPSGVKTLWAMREYHTTCLLCEQRTYVICKIMHKGQARDFLYGDGAVGNFPSGSNEVRNLPSGGSEVGNFTAGSNNSSDQMNNNQVGFRFSPTDEELINFYLNNKILGNNFLVDNWISEINIHSYEPESLPALSKIKSNDLVWYFFSPYESTKRKKTTPSGFWKSTGVDRKIKDKGGNDCQIGIVKTLVYHEGKGPNGVRTPLVMHEYHTTCLPIAQTYVICKIMYKGEGGNFPSVGNEVGILPSGGNEAAGNFPSAGNEVGNFSSAGNEVGNFPSGGNNSSDLRNTFVAESSSARATTLTKMDKPQQNLAAKQAPVVDSNTVRAANFAKMYKFLQNLPSVEIQGKLNSDDAP